MAEIPEIVLPHGGYRKLIAYRKSKVIYQGTVLFCKRFLPARGDRTVDQMVQAARSGKQNIAEGSSASGTSRETEIKLTNVARASLDELLEDYLDWIKAHGAEEWAREDSRKIAAKDFAKEHPDWEDWKGIFESRPAETLCNLQIVLIHQTRYLLERMIRRQEVDFKRNGGVRKRMHAARVAARGGNWAAGLRDCLGGSGSAEELERRVVEARREMEWAAWGVRREKGWGQ
jgi:four helix bundle suffix protein